MILCAGEIFKNLVLFLLKLGGAQWLFVSVFMLQGACERAEDLAANSLYTLHTLMNWDRYS